MKKMNELKEEYQSVKAPEKGLELVEMKMKEAEEMKMKKNKCFVKPAVTAAAVFVTLLILPNTNENIAKAMSNLPAVGKFFDVVTVRDYQYKDERHEANVKVPEVVTKDKNSNAVDQVNKSVQEYTEEAIKQFKQDIKEYGEGYESLDVNYSVVTNDENWFVLEVLTEQVQASGFETARYYNIYKNTDQVVSLGDLFRKGYDYVTPISDIIIEEMRKQMKENDGAMYFLDDKDMPEFNFKQIKEDQNFYINSKGQLVIAFGEAEVGPASMGRPEFVILDQDILQNMIL